MGMRPEGDETMIYKTLAKEKQTGKLVVVELDCFSKRNFIRDVRSNGYSVNPKRVLTKKSYDFVIENTNCYASDWHEYTDEQIRQLSA
jgi:hypothetical protein